MAWIDKLDRKFYRLGVPNLMLYVVIGNVIVYVFDILFVAQGGTAFSNLLSFAPSLVLQGQVWRIITFIFVPTNASLFWLAISLYFYYFVGSSLEREWGSFRFTMYYLVGMLGTVLGGMAAYFISNTATNFGPGYLNLSLFFAFATLFPNTEFRLFFIIPIKVKYLGYVNAAFFLFAIITQALPDKISAIMAIINYLIFCGPSLFNKLRFNLASRKSKRAFQNKMNNTWNQ